MSISSLAELPKEEIARICREYGVEELLVFGSFAKGVDIRANSDVDFLVVFEGDDYGPWMSKLQMLEKELTGALGRRTEVVPKNGLKWVIRDEVLSTAIPVYAKG